MLKQKLYDATLKHAEQLNDLEQYGRRNSIRIAGLPSDSENQPSAVVANEMASLLTKKLGMPIATTDIDLNAEVLASLRLKEPDLIERAWSFEGKLFVRYRRSDRREIVSYEKYREWLDKPSKLDQPDRKPTGVQRALGRFREMTLVCPKAAHKGAYFLAI
ncbi:hypothetical protein DPMN_050802 [Dreissena polymorpha]|uniref:Uncharacterized protein n=1 Tax=Dreissena polymorpha TaxID=45954 RepID=A0A9D4HNF3_DREPO|nr:hypothetical protein DPMN_050802 [Dreissena polymorpha]